jgi:hypothetical protein
MIIWSINGLVNGDQFAKGSSWNGSVVGEKTENLFDDRRVLRCVIVDGRPLQVFQFSTMIEPACRRNCSKLSEQRVD